MTSGDGLSWSRYRQIVSDARYAIFLGSLSAAFTGSLAYFLQGGFNSAPVGDFSLSAFVALPLLALMGAVFFLPVALAIVLVLAVPLHIFFVLLGYSSRWLYMGGGVALAAVCLPYIFDNPAPDMWFIILATGSSGGLIFHWALRADLSNIDAMPKNKAEVTDTDLSAKP